MSVLLQRLSRLLPLCRRRSGLPGLLLALSEVAENTLLARDFAHFESVVLTGDLYNELVTDCRAAGFVLPSDADKAREKVKRLLMRDVLAKKGRYSSFLETVFREVFPTVHHFVRWINQGDHGELIRTLQRLESWLVVENVAPRLIGRFPIITLHDAIYARTKDLPAVEHAFEETSEELGIRLRVKTETPAPDATSDERNSRPALTGT